MNISEFKNTNAWSHIMDLDLDDFFDKGNTLTSFFVFPALLAMCLILSWLNSWIDFRAYSVAILMVISLISAATWILRAIKLSNTMFKLISDDLEKRHFLEAKPFLHHYCQKENKNIKWAVIETYYDTKGEKDGRKEGAEFPHLFSGLQALKRAIKNNGE